ncbi:MAG: DUF192 domain-containing protein [bacterium]
MNHFRARFTQLAIASSLLACNAEPKDADEAPVLSFDVARVRLVNGTDTTQVHVELAKTPEQQTLGLMERRHLADTAGMLFLYSANQPASAGFWMFRTRIPLDIAFVDSLGRIVSIIHMVPCTSTLVEGCPSYPPNAAYRAALEVSAGYFARHKLALGDRVMLSDSSQRVRR